MKRRITEYKGCRIRLKPKKLIPIYLHGNTMDLDFIIETDTKRSDLTIPIRVRFPGECIGLNFKIEVAELLPNKPQVEAYSFYLDYIGTYQVVISLENGHELQLGSFVAHSGSGLFLTAIGAFMGALVAGLIIHLLFN